MSRWRQPLIMTITFRWTKLSTTKCPRLWQTFYTVSVSLLSGAEYTRPIVSFNQLLELRSFQDGKGLLILPLTQCIRQLRSAIVLQSFIFPCQRCDYFFMSPLSVSVNHSDRKSDLLLFFSLNSILRCYFEKITQSLLLLLRPKVSRVFFHESSQADRFKCSSNEKKNSSTINTCSPNLTFTKVILMSLF